MEQKALPKIIDEGDFDLIHAETFYVSPHIPKNTELPIVLVDQTIEYKVYEHFVRNFKFFFLRPLLYIDVLKLKYWETFYWERASRVVAVSDKDVTAMSDILGKRKVRLNPNGVGEDLMKKIGLHYCKTVVFMGNYAWMQNSEAARMLAKQVFPLIKEKIPDARLVIAGQHTEKLTDLKDDGVDLVDFSVDDLDGQEKVFKTSGVLVAPLYGPGGTRLKILAAMAAHLPVVTTSVGIAGIGKNGESYLEGETAEKIAEQTVRILGDKKLYEKVAENARKLVEDKYSYQAIAKDLDKIYQEVLDERKQ